MADTEEIYGCSPVHEWFGLSYANYLTIPRLALQEMPVRWQRRFVDLMDEFHRSGMETPDYHVLRAGEKYTRAERYDPEDEGSRFVEFYALREDPWADYRRGSVAGAQHDQ